MKTKIQIKSVFGNVLFEYESENNTIKKTVEKAVKESRDLRYANLESANLGSANLGYADLRYAKLESANLESANLESANLGSANLRYANLESADLESADLRYAKLESADLRYANLESADLRYAKLNKRYIQVSCIGSRKGMTTYCFDDDIIWCGCFQGSLEEFKKEVKETHAKNEQYLEEYLGLINYLESLK